MKILATIGGVNIATFAIHLLPKEAPEFTTDIVGLCIEPQGPRHFWLPFSRDS